MKCRHCERDFSPRRPDQVYCGSKCRQAFNAARRGDGALRAAVSSVRVLRRGDVSVVIRFRPIDRDNALQIAPGQLLEVIRG